MRLLWLKYGELLPVDTGGKLRSFNLLTQLARQVELTFVSYADPGHDPDYPRRIAEVLPGSRFIVAGDIPGWREVAMGPGVTSLRTGAPLHVTRFASRAVRTQLEAWLASERFDVLLCDFLTPTLCLPRNPGVPTVLFEHNVETEVWERRTRTVASGIHRMVYEYEAWATRRWERRMLRQFDLTLAVSEQDRRSLLGLAPAAAVHVMETGVDYAAFQPDEPVTRSDRLVSFIGSMDWQPNEDGVRWFVEAIWPAVKAELPDAVFRVVGRRPPASILALRSDDVEVTGDVDSVVPHLAESALTVVPLRAGGGTRLKIFEAMAAGAPVLSTSLGAEGLPVAPGSDIAIADSAETMATELVRLLRTPGERALLAANGRRLAEAHDWSRIAADLAERLGTVTREAA